MAKMRLRICSECFNVTVSRWDEEISAIYCSQCRKTTPHHFTDIYLTIISKVAVQQEIDEMKDRCSRRFHDE